MMISQNLLSVKLCKQKHNKYRITAYQVCVSGRPKNSQNTHTSMYVFRYYINKIIDETRESSSITTTTPQSVVAFILVFSLLI